MKQKITNKLLDKITTRVTKISYEHIIKHLDDRNFWFDNYYDKFKLFKGIPRDFPSIEIYFSHKNIKYIISSAEYFNNYSLIKVHLEFNKKNKKILKKLQERLKIKICNCIRHELQHYKQYKKNKKSYKIKKIIYEQIKNKQKDNIIKIKNYYLNNNEINANISAHVLTNKLYKIQTPIDDIVKYSFTLNNNKKHPEYKKITNEIINKYKTELNRYIFCAKNLFL